MIIPITKVNQIALISILPLALVLGTPFVILNGFDDVGFAKIRSEGILNSFISITLIFVAGVVIHEMLHGLTWAIFAKKHWRSISFGVKWEYFTPYCHCSESLKKNHFILGAIMPCLMIGVLPVVVSYFTGSFRVWFWGYFFTVAAMGDLTAIWYLRKAPSNSLIQDHDSELGFRIIIPE